MRSVQSYKYYIYARCCPGQVGRWNLIVACGMLKPVYFAFVKTMLEFLQTTHFVKSRAHLPRPTRKIIAMIALRHAILMRADPVVKVHAHCLFSGRARSCKKDPCLNSQKRTRLYRVWCSLLKKYSVIKHTIEQYTVNEVNVNSYDIRYTPEKHEQKRTCKCSFRDASINIACSSEEAHMHSIRDYALARMALTKA